MGAIESMRKEISDCDERVEQTEVRISNVEEEIQIWRAKVDTFEYKGKALEEKVIDLEDRSQRKKQTNKSTRGS